jgi:ABC-type nitrate/sulfonate/bicarbonate transport system permease component
MRLPGWLRFRREIWLSVISIPILLLLWEVVVDLGWVKSPFLPSPWTIAKATVQLMADGELGGHLSVTLARMFIGFLAGAVPGLIIGLAMGWSRTLRALLDPVVSVVYPLPKVTLLPLAMLLIGVGEQAMLFVVALAALFPVLINSIAGVLNIEPLYFEVAQNYGASRWQTFTKVILPGSLPMAFAGIRLALGLALLSTVVVELAIATKGLGAMLWLSWETLRIERIYVGIGVIAILGLLLNPLVQLLARRLIPWKDEQ